jgi:hypothetical protein
MERGGVLFLGVPGSSAERCPILQSEECYSDCFNSSPDSDHSGCSSLTYSLHVPERWNLQPSLSIV